jgi:hypothetical protein
MKQMSNKIKPDKIEIGQIWKWNPCNTRFTDLSVPFKIINQGNYVYGRRTWMVQRPGIEPTADNWFFESTFLVDAKMEFLGYENAPTCLCLEAFNKEQVALNLMNSSKDLKH